jgi:hypothetical protein
MNREFLVPGLVAIALAVLFPLYWLSGIFSGSDQSLLELFKADVTRLSPIDALFVLIGLMEIYLYLSLRRLLQQYLQGGLPAVLSAIVAVLVAVLTATVLFDVFLAIGPGMSDGVENSLVLAAGIMWLGSSLLIGLVGLILAISLLFISSGTGVLRKLFAIFLLISSVLTLTVILSPIAILVYPLALLLLGAWFLRGELEVEVV